MGGLPRSEEGPALYPGPRTDEARRVSAFVFHKGVLVVVTLIPAGRILRPACKNRERVSLRYDNAPETNSIVCDKCVESCVFVRGRN